MSELTIVGGGLAGSEAAWRCRTCSVRLYEMRPGKLVPYQYKPGNWSALTLGSNLPDQEWRFKETALSGISSLRCAEAASVPAGEPWLSSRLLGNGHQ
jgi:methylenetetrahydrofolate--tRNA-(uracil-5-)-methyltransferase